MADYSRQKIVFHSEQVRIFFDQYHKEIISPDDYKTPEQVREFFQSQIALALAPEELKGVAMSHLVSYMNGYNEIEAIGEMDRLEFEEEGTFFTDRLGIPSDFFRFRSAFPEIMMHLISQNAGILELFLADFP